MLTCSRDSNSSEECSFNKDLATLTRSSLCSSADERRSIMISKHSERHSFETTLVCKTFQTNFKIDIDLSIFPRRTIRLSCEANDLTILDIAQKNGIDIEGSCEGSLACSTCHIIVDKDWYSKLDKPSWDEDDMLDLATGLTLTSRLGCQIILTDKLDGLKISLPFVHNDVRLNKKKY